MSIGLKRGTVKLQPYNEQWPVEYEREKALLLGFAGDVIARIEHIGSTSVPGLKAKPVIDIGIEVESENALTQFVALLPSDQYEYFGERDIVGDYFFAKGHESSRTHYLHVSLQGSPRLANYLKFKQALIDSALLQQQYGAIKEYLAENHVSDRKRYTQLKGQLISKVLAN